MGVMAHLGWWGTAESDSCFVVEVDELGVVGGGLVGCVEGGELEEKT